MLDRHVFVFYWLADVGWTTQPPTRLAWFFAEILFWVGNIRIFEVELVGVSYESARVRCNFVESCSSVCSKKGYTTMLYLDGWWYISQYLSYSSSSHLFFVEGLSMVPESDIFLGNLYIQTANRLLVTVCWGGANLRPKDHQSPPEVAGVLWGGKLFIFNWVYIHKKHQTTTKQLYGYMTWHM